MWWLHFIASFSLAIFLIKMMIMGLSQIVLLVQVSVSNRDTSAIDEHQVFHVLPDDLTNDSCSFQPCATLGQYLC